VKVDVDDEGAIAFDENSPPADDDLHPERAESQE